ncbi:MAG: hypothetical protein ACO3A2_03405 [Bdellovibrionia bacterium]
MVVRDLNTALEWQKVNLEDRLQAKLIKAINPSIPGQFFIVNVNLELKQKQDDVGDSTDDSSDQLDSPPLLGKLDLEAPKFRENKKGEDEDSNIFKNIQKVRVNVILDRSVTEAKKEVIKKIITPVISSIGAELPALVIDQAELISAEPQDLKKWLYDFKQPLVLLIVALIFALVVIFIFNGYRKIESRRISILESQNNRAETEAQTRIERETAEAERAAIASSGLGDPQKGTLEEGRHREGFEKFKILLKESPEKAAALVKQWVKAPGRGSSEALAVLPQELSTEEILLVFKHMSMDDRKSWRKLLSPNVDQATLAVASRFIFSQIVESLLTPPPMINDELRSMISELSIPECIEIALQDAELGGLLVNILPSMEVGRMFSLMNPELANTVTIASLKFSEESIRLRSNDLKAAIETLKGKRKPSTAPFVDGATELFKHIGPEKESPILGALIESQEFDLLNSAVHQYFPAELVFKLPPRVLKLCLDRLPIQKRADFILSTDEESQSILLNSVGKPGSKVRDVIDVEVQQAKEDEIRMKRLERNKSVLLKEFLDVVRLLIRTNQAIEEQADAVIDVWLSEKTGGQIQGSSYAKTSA